MANFAVLGTRVRIAIGLVLAVFVAMILAKFTDIGDPALATAGITTLCASWWILEPIPIAATSIIPFAAFPLLNVTDHKSVAGAYGHHLILLLMGGFVLSRAVETVGAHRRIALGMVRLTGGGSRNVVLGFMMASALCSMWISNTATALMLLPVAIAVIDQTEDDRLAIPLLLGIAYAASIGGVGTLIGTPPNVFFASFYSDKMGHDYGFLEWMKLGVPIVVVMLPLAWLFLTRNLKADDQDRKPLVLPKVGAWSSAEVRVMAIFGCAALMWMFRGVPNGGWAALIGTEGAGDSTVALVAVLALFLIPDNRGKPLITWKEAESIPWGLLLLFGGGIAIARAFDSSGLDVVIGKELAAIAGGKSYLVVGVICLSVTFLTEVVSNTATTTLLMPLLFAAAAAARVLPESLLIPAALSASCAFMLPVATAPNAIVFGTGKVASTTMLREGFVLNILGVIVISSACLLLL